jgi:probable HAF family extracellular repeat protein
MVRFRALSSPGAKYREITPPGATQTSVSGISTSAELVGFETQGSNNVDFAFSHGKYQRIVITNAPAAFLYGINPQGTALVGQYEPTNGIVAGFLYQNKTLQTLQFPGSNVTSAYGLNDAGQVVGLFVDSSGVQHGFTWTPPGEAAKK